LYIHDAHWPRGPATHAPPRAKIMPPSPGDQPHPPPPPWNPRPDLLYIALPCRQARHRHCAREADLAHDMADDGVVDPQPRPCAIQDLRRRQAHAGEADLMHDAADNGVADH
jgi:hypothetical protein